MQQDAAGEGYFLYHSIGQYPRKGADMAQALEAFSMRWAAGDDSQWPDALARKQRFLDLWTRLLNAPPGTVTSCESVTAGLYSLIGALPDDVLRGKRVLVAQDCFPSLHFLLAGLQARLGFELQTVPLQPGAFWVSDDQMIEAWGPDVAVALLTWVTSTASHRGDVARLLAHGRKMGSLTGLDVTQGIGLIPFDLQDTPADFVLSTSLKWLGGAPGAGIIQASSDLISRCLPEFRGWFSQENPFSWDLDRFEFAGDIRRFDNGTPAVMAAAASIPALERAFDGNHGARLTHNRELSSRLIEGLAARNIPLSCPADAAQRGGSVMAQLPDAQTAADLVARLREDGIYTDARGRILRMSPGELTSLSGVTRLLAALG